LKHENDETLAQFTDISPRDIKYVKSAELTARGVGHGEQVRVKHAPVPRNNVEARWRSGAARAAPKQMIVSDVSPVMAFT
jgi:hypothetical protein